MTFSLYVHHLKHNEHILNEVAKATNISNELSSSGTTSLAINSAIVYEHFQYTRFCAPFGV